MLDDMKARLGTVIPVWFPESAAEEEMLALLRLTVADVEAYCGPAKVFLTVDGCARAEGPAGRAAAEVGERCGTPCRVVVRGENTGKGGVVAAGFELLLEDSAVDLLVARDNDGDHDVYDLPRLVRRLQATRDREGTDNVFAVGSRRAPQMALGWVRGEYELLLNRVLVEAVNHSLAPAGRRADLRYSLPQTRYPDFQSGYKLYTRETAQVVIDATHGAHEADPSADVMRWGAEFVTVAELLLGGAIAVEVSRASYDEQPQTTFDESDRTNAFGRQFVWLLRRLGTPPEVARLILDNAIAQSPIRFATGLWAELLALRKYIWERAYPSAELPSPPPHGELL